MSAGPLGRGAPRRAPASRSTVDAADPATYLNITHPATEEPMNSQAMPPVVDRATWRAARDEILTREKAHTREGDAIAAARRRIPMTLMPPVSVAGPDGPVPLLEVFEGRRMLMAYFHMWHDGQAWENQCEGCTFSTCHMQVLDYLHARDVTYAVFCEGSYEESAP